MRDSRAMPLVEGKVPRSDAAQRQAAQRRGKSRYPLMTASIARAPAPQILRRIKTAVANHVYG